jgi:hypothetical protein
MKKINVFVAVIALVLAVSTTAFKPAHKTDPVHWVFVGETMGEAYFATNYEPNAEAPSCSPGNNLPCSIVGDEDPEIFQQYLDGFTTDGALKGAAENLRP